MYSSRTWSSGYSQPYSGAGPLRAGLGVGSLELPVMNIQGERTDDRKTMAARPIVAMLIERATTAIAIAALSMAFLLLLLELPLLGNSHSKSTVS